MSFNFDNLPNRRSTNSYKWDIREDEIPMWVADMDFDTAPVIRESLRERLLQGAYGYNSVPDSFAESIIQWWSRRHHFQIESDWILFCTGVVPAISSIVRKMTRENDNVVVLSPVYNIFYNSISNNNRKVLASELLYEDSEYQIDFDDLEEKLADCRTSLFIFCNPHNPIGKVWSRDILEKLGELCIKHDVLILSDEIHCDLTHVGYQYTPFASISEKIAMQSITCIAPTKTFNLAGLQTSAIVIPNPEIRQLVNRGINTDEVAEPNTFAIQAAEAAFNEGEEWLNELIIYLDKNRNILKSRLELEAPEVTLLHSEATYLAWLDCSRITDNTTMLCEYLRNTTGLYLSAGDIFGGNGQYFIRWNYATSSALLNEGIDRFVKGIKAYQEEN